MNKLEVKNINKSFKNFKLSVNFQVKEGEFVSILGPSGSGKTTTLHIIAGFVKPDYGNIIKDGNNITDLPPGKRNIGIVFQDYALFPYLNVFDNIAFGLRIKRESRKDIKKRVFDIAGKMDIINILYKYPGRISGGEKQRVALSRAMIVQPDILLMDEPLSSLDAKIRSELMEELKIFHKETNATILYITHDQSEAMYLSNRIILINKGEIDQIDTPMGLYEYPKTEFARQFIGKMNKLSVNGQEIYVRPEDIVIGKDGKLKGTVKEVAYLEGTVEIKIDFFGTEVLAHEFLRNARDIKKDTILYFDIKGDD